MVDILNITEMGIDFCVKADKISQYFFIIRCFVCFFSSMDDLDEVEEIEFEHAIKSTGFGKFNILLMAICGLTYANTAISVNILGFVLPAATCDFKLTSAHKGVLSGTPVFGMLFGSYFWGCLADTKGRKLVLTITLVLDGCFGLLSALCTNYYLFLIFRFFNGFS